ncbi:MAG: thioredoxin domain-containing protein [Candidatus Hydrothermarchaeota archaeon]
MMQGFEKHLLVVFLIVMLVMLLIPSEAEEAGDFEGYLSPAGILYDYSPEKFHEALNNGKPTVLEFSADRCGVCRMMIPTVRALRTKYKGIVDIITVNVDTAEGLKLSRKYGERYLPTFTFFDRYGRPVKKLSGYREKEELESVINSLLRGVKLTQIPKKETYKEKKEPKLTGPPTTYIYEGELLKEGKGFYQGFLSFGEIFTYENYGLRLIDTEKNRAYINVLYKGKKSPLSGSLNSGESLDIGEAKLTLLDINSDGVEVKVELPSSMRYRIVRETKFAPRERLGAVIVKEIENYNPIVGQEMSVLLKVENLLDKPIKIEIVDTAPKDFEVINGSLIIADILGGGEFKTYSYRIRPEQKGDYEIPNANLIYYEDNQEKIIISEKISIHVSEDLEHKGIIGLLSSIFDRLLELLGLEKYTI